MVASMIVVDGRNAGKKIRLARPTIFIGRADDCHLRLHGNSVSRHHCVLLVEDDFLAVRDLGSRQGTFVNGERIAVETELNSGDRLRVGRLEFEVRMCLHPHQRASEPSKTREPPAAGADAAEENDLDLDNWLKETEPPETADTDLLDEASAGDPASASPRSDVQGKRRKKSDQEPHSIVGVWKEGHRQPTSIDPSHAAADSLKNFLRRR